MIVNELLSENQKIAPGSATDTAHFLALLPRSALMTLGALLSRTWEW
jgi:hypothetical protein